eukprot:scaffold9709_cov126-Skeletonema_dohrnii-CCMP3373.AAC.6
MTASWPNNTTLVSSCLVAVCIALTFIVCLDVPTTHLLGGIVENAEKRGVGHSMLRIQGDFGQSLVTSESNKMEAVDSEEDPDDIYELKRGEDDVGTTSALEEQKKSGTIRITSANSLVKDADSKKENMPPSLDKEQEEEAPTQDEQIIGSNNNNNNESYKQMIIKMEAENKHLRNKLNEEEEKINSLQRNFSLYEQRSLSEKILMTDLTDSSSKVKDELIDLIISNYASSSSPYEQFEKLDSAFEAVEFKHSDGEPAQVNGYPFLFVGSVGSSLNKKALMANNITHVVNWSSSARCNVFGGIEYRCFQGISGRMDMKKMENVKKLSDAVEFVERARRAGGSVLSHCWWGSNRSVTLIVAYLMKYGSGMGINEATALVAETRPQANPYGEVLNLYKKNYLDAKVGK